MIEKMSIKEIKSFVQDEQSLTKDFLENLARDERAGVRQIYQQIINRKRKFAQEEERILKMYKFEQELYSMGYQCIAGIDEVGRGPLAGPVLAAAVILPTTERIMGLNDSKKLTADKRETLAEIIKDKAIGYAYGQAEAQEIDELNIYQATIKAMQRAIETLRVEVDYLLIDALKLPHVEIPQNAIIGGDGKSASIAAASILAKVHRDQLMDRYHEKYPQYGFNSNKGYGTKEHIEAIHNCGHCPIHRRSFKIPGLY